MDITFLLWLQQLRQALGGVFDNFILQVTALGESTFTFLLLAGIYWCIDKRAGQYIWFNISFGCTINQFMKHVFHVERPWIRDSRITPVERALAGAGGYSFPSGHAARATAVWGALGVSAWRDKKGKGIAFFSWAVLAGILFSRNYLGVHTLQDVIVSLIIGIVLLYVTDKVINWTEKKDNRDIIVCVAGCILCFLPMLKVGCLSNAGAGMGFLIGWVMERHFIKFETVGDWQKKVFRFTVGAILILGILTTLPQILSLVMPARYASFFTMFILAIFITAIYPLLFTKTTFCKVGIGAGIAIFLLLIIVVVFMVQRANAQSEEAKVVEASQAEQAQQEQSVSEATQTGTDSIEKAVHETVADINSVQIIAHRGYSTVFPENTLISLAGAMDIGADMIELDVQQTSDGVIVLFHDDDLMRVTGEEGSVADYTYGELSEMEVGSWFAEEYRGEKIPTLAEALDLIKDSEIRVYLELKDIGEVEGFEEAVLALTEEKQMTERCLFASFRYEYLQQLKKIDSEIQVLYNTVEVNISLPEQYEADYYGLHMEKTTQEVIDEIHAAGKKAFIWTVDEPADMRTMIAMGADGITTNKTGLAKVVMNPGYGFLTDYYADSLIMPGLYGRNLPEICADMIVQGMTQAEDKLVVTAYSHSGENNSILYILNTMGHLEKIVDLGFKAHVGGTAYDAEHGLLWITGAEGFVYSLSWQTIKEGVVAGEILSSFGAELVNHNGGKVASFLDIYDGKLYVGSYTNGVEGKLRVYDIAEPSKPRLKAEQTIPERIQGITFAEQENRRIMLLSQGYQTEDSGLLIFNYDEMQGYFKEPIARYTLPEGVEQIEITPNGMYLLFESAVRPYRKTARIPNDRIFLVNLDFLKELQ